MMASDKWPYTAHMRNRNHRAKRNHRIRKQQEKVRNMDSEEIQDKPMSPHMRNLVNLIIAKSEELGKLAATEGNDGMVALAAMANETFSMLMEQE